MSGKGRDDLTQIAILVEAESLIFELQPQQAKSLRGLAEKICQTLPTFRLLLNKYRQNLDSVDP